MHTTAHTPLTHALAREMGWETDSDERGWQTLNAMMKSEVNRGRRVGSLLSDVFAPGTFHGVHRFNPPYICTFLSDPFPRCTHSSLAATFVVHSLLTRCYTRCVPPMHSLLNGCNARRSVCRAIHSLLARCSHVFQPLLWSNVHPRGYVPSEHSSFTRSVDR